jgi:DNA repair exonuclease SbcCD nuclease subunit
MAERDYIGLLAIGDPHLEGRIPGFRKDDYPRVVLDKLRWCLNYTRDERLLPVILGDLFQMPRDNPNWVLGELMELLPNPVPAIYGNHDCRENALSEHDTFDVLVRAGKLQMLDAENVWRGRMGGQPVVIGGTSWGLYLPKAFEPDGDGHGEPLVFWLVHHDVQVPGYEEQGRFAAREIPGVHVVINGHIHRRLEEVTRGGTVWITPGNISRRNRGDATREHRPAVLRIDVTERGYEKQWVEVPHRPFDEVFHQEVIESADALGSSAFVAGLSELESRRTDTGAGLMAFLDKNLGQFEDAVADEIRQLAREVTSNGEA